MYTRNGALPVARPQTPCARPCRALLTSSLAVKPTPPIFEQPASLVVDAQDATGATVSYTPPVAVDALSPTNATGPGTATVSCFPGSGTKFVVGTTLVRWVAG